MDALGIECVVHQVTEYPEAKSGAESDAKMVQFFEKYFAGRSERSNPNPQSPS
jgi:hypothetical protein